ncbi:MAG: type I restriction-modification system subunit M [Bryobacterales bacterium]|nr:type I restriction-modification system subunit M [Bryobacterales bacterium]
MARAKTETQQPLTTAQQLGSLIKSARDTMRKDKGLNGDLDRLPMLTWIMFLKFLDDLELVHEQKAKVAGKPHKPIIQPPYRWRDWAAKEEGITGDDLIRFINQQEATRPDGKKGMGLFEYLRQLRGTNGGKDQRDVIANIFRGVINRMTSGYLLREVINKVNGIHFSSSEEIHTLSHLYESMLKEMRDAAGDSGEFYTPRAVVRFMVDVLDPRLGETILDPACGTGGFLVESFSHLSKQAKTVRDRQILQAESIVGGEAKPLPYLLSQMNLLLHGVEAPAISPTNSLAVPLREIGDRDRVDVILTNPPFGGEEEKGIQGNFPEDKQTSETALLFLQLIMRRLRRTPKPGRAGVVVPNGLLYGDGIAARIKGELLKEFNLHTIVRLPKGVFSPYTNIPTNLLFFDRSKATAEIWYYEPGLPQGQKNYTKTNPLSYEDLSGCLEWWHHRTETERAWKVSVEQVLRTDDEGKLVSVDLDLPNPNNSERHQHQPPDQLIHAVAIRSNSVVHELHKVAELVQSLNAHKSLWDEVPLGEVMALKSEPHTVDSQCEYPNIGIYSFGKGLFEKAPINGLTTSATTLYRVRSGQFIYSRLFAFEGAYGLVSPQFDGYFVSNEYPTFECDNRRLLPDYLVAYFSIPEVWKRAAATSKGLGDRRQRVQPSHNTVHLRTF